MRHVSSLTVALCAAGLSVPALAQETVAPVVVTATRTAQTADQSLAAVTVVERRDIERSAAGSLAELLAGLPGIQTLSNGSYGKASSLLLRGTDSDHVLVLVDGVRLGSATLGSTAFEHLPLEQIERIEIVRGPRSSLYGADALGGVIQIFTRRDTGSQFSAGAGSHDSYRVGAGHGATHGATRYRLELNQFGTAGYNLREGNHPDEDGYLRTALSATLDHRFAAHNDLSLHLLRSEGNSDYDGYDTSRRYESDIVQQALGARWRTAPSAAWHSTVSLGESRDESEEYADGVPDGTFRTRRFQAGWQNDLQVGDSTLLTLGLDHLDDRVSGSTAYSRDSRTNNALYAQAQFASGGHDWLLGLRVDDNEAFGQETTGNLAWGHDLGPQLRLTAAYGTAFKAPTFNDLYYQDPWGSNGNPDLRPEQAGSAELGLQGRAGGARWQLRAYRTEVSDLIQWMEVATWTWQPQNVSRARIDGMELELATQLAGWDTALSLNLTDARDSDTDKRLPYRAGESLRLDAGRGYGAWRTDVSWLLQGPRYADAANSRELAGYGTVNLSLSYALAKAWTARAAVLNLFDQPYEELRGYAISGRTAFLSVTYRPE